MNHCEIKVGDLKEHSWLARGYEVIILNLYSRIYTVRRLFSVN
jgi:hypothetical protein